MVLTSKILGNHSICRRIFDIFQIFNMNIDYIDVQDNCITIQFCSENCLPITKKVYKNDNTGANITNSFSCCCSSIGYTQPYHYPTLVTLLRDLKIDQIIE